MKIKRVMLVILGCASCVISGSADSQLPSSVPIHAAEPLSLATNGKTDYRIVISAGATAGEAYAAKELDHFLREMTGTGFPVVRDTEPSSQNELVLGRTNRLNPDAIPAKLKPRNMEGFVIYRKGATLFIMGNIPRGTLYGVYDFLEVELGCRFLDKDYTYVPRRPDLQVVVVSRQFEPVLEYRNIMGAADVTGAVRNRLNARWSSVPMEKELGGVKFVGPSFVHTVGYLVPADTYFEEHPEYYALSGGKRQKTQEKKKGGVVGQLCLTHPDVLAIAIASVRDWIESHNKSPRSNPDSIAIVSVSPNDNSLICECPNCQAINKEEEAQSGTLIRFVNAVAEDVEKDYPNARIETLGYGPSLIPPARTVPRKNVIIRFAPISADFARPFATQPLVCETIERWSQITDCLYVWNYHYGNHAYFRPFPDLNALEQNVRFLIDHGVRGYFGEHYWSRGAALRVERNYLLAKLLWRPETDARLALLEFCRLYYGAAANGVLRYIDMVHSNFLEQNIPLNQTDAFIPDGTKYSYDFLVKADGVLARAEGAAKTPEEKLRVQTVRLSTSWMLIDKAFSGQMGSSSPLPLKWKFQLDPNDAGVALGWPAKASFDDWDDIRVDDSWTKQGHDYHGTAWYALPIQIGPELAGRMVKLAFGAIDGRYQMFLNGRQFDERLLPPGDTWNSSFVVKLPEPLPEGRHVLAVRVWKESHAAGIWRPVLLQDKSAELPAIVRNAGEHLLKLGPRIGVTVSGSRTEMDDFYQRVRTLLKKDEALKDRALSDRGIGSILPGTIQQFAALLPNSHLTYSVIADDDALIGSAVMQTADRNWTLGQTCHWSGMRPHLAKAQQTGQRYRLRARIRVDKKGKAGTAFRFGYGWYADDSWAGGVCDSITVQAADVAANVWTWYELPDPVTYRDDLKKSQFAFVLVPNNNNISCVAIDAFELALAPLAKEWPTGQDKP